MKERSLNIKVLLTSKPIAMISLMFSFVTFLISSKDIPFQRYFSSSVICMTSGTLKVSWSHLVNINGIKCPKCNAEDEGPLPVYRKNGFFSSNRFNITWRSRWEKKIFRRKKWWTFWLVNVSILWSKSSVNLLQPKRTKR